MKIIPIDVVYFDFSKAFDSVNHDILLDKLKNQFSIDGRLLKFLANYLKNRTQAVALDGKLSVPKPVLPGVPQGSILGPLLFVLFINDINVGLSQGTEISLYADDTKIWRPIHNQNDCFILQNDIDHLYNWSVVNKMSFHPHKCKVLSVCKKDPPLLGILPFIETIYLLGNVQMDNILAEKDLGITINNRLTWGDHHNNLISKASQMLGMTKRTCHFIYNSGRKRALYIALVRSQFEHCSPVWRPHNPSNSLIRFENIQKRAIKWILSEEHTSYGCHARYLLKCVHVNLLPIGQIFDFNDFILFYKIIYRIIPLELPSYISVQSGISRLRNRNIDELSYISAIQPTSCRSPLVKSYFYRTIIKWNMLPFDLRNCPTLAKFRKHLLVHLWKEVLLELCTTNDFLIDSYD